MRILSDTNIDFLKWRWHALLLSAVVLTAGIGTMGARGIPLGIDESTRYEEYTIHGLHPDTIILVGTDGIWEAANPDAHLFGKDRIRRVLREAPRTASAADIVHSIEHELATFCADVRPHDDITLVVMRLQPLPATDARLPASDPGNQIAANG